MPKIAIFFPGIGYTVDKPLMYYTRKLASQCDYDIKLMTYTGFPKKVIGDTQKMQESYEIALKQTEDMLKDINFEEYDDILFVGKSVGTAVATSYANAHGLSERVRMILFTPVEFTFDNPISKGIVFTGTADPWVGGTDSRIDALCKEKNIPDFIYENANHSLETGDIEFDLVILKDATYRILNFIQFSK